MEGRPVRLWAAQNALQPLHPVELPGRVRAHLRGFGCQGWCTRTADDRYHPPQGAPHGGEPAAKGGSRHIGRTNGGLNSKLHAACDGQGKPIALLLTEGERSDHHGAALLLPVLPQAYELLGDRGYEERPLLGLHAAAA